MNISLPSFDELVTAGKKPICTESAGKEDRSFSVIKPVIAAQKLKVAAYCRVSTDYEEQQSSIQIQKEHFSSLAAKHPDWEFSGIYADIVSGTKKEKRPELNRLLSDCAAGSINLVLTESVSRFARNTTDLLEMVRSLTAIGTDIFFERENIDTRTMDSEFLLTILASLAEDESHSISANCRWGLQRRFQDGSYRAANAPYGYDLVDGTYTMNSEEAEIVREIFRRRIEGETTGQIAKELNRRNIPTKRAGEVWKGKEVSGKWTSQRILMLLKNEAYIGDLLLQKCYTDSNFQMKINYGTYPQYYLKDHHPAIISRDDFDTVKNLLLETGWGRPKEINHHTFTGMLYCEYCGSVFYRIVNRRGNAYWVCKKHRHKASDCPSIPVAEAEIEEAFIRVMERLKTGEAVASYKERIKQEFREENLQVITELEGRLEEIDKEIHGFERARLRGAADASGYLSQLNKLRSERMEIESQLGRMGDKRITETEELQKLVNSRCGSFVFEEDTFLGTVEKVTVHGREDFTFHFRCGLEERSGR